jgi:general secretion pathway protein A
MYTAFFGLSENPFNITPDQRFLFLSKHHIKALDHLRYGIKERKGFMVISGGVGTGKTTLCRTLLNEPKDSLKTAFVFNTTLSDIELLETVNQEFGIRTEASTKSKKQHIDLLNQFLLDNHSKGGNAVLIIDEAQNLSRKALEQLRMLSNLETDREKLLQIVLVGQPELAERLKSPDLKQLYDRITVRFHLKPLERRDIQRYLDHRLLVAGGRGSVTFDRGAVRAVYAYSLGNPRRINAICDRALLIAYCRDEFSVTRDIVQRAIDDMRGGFSPPTFRLQWFQRKLAPAAAVTVMAFLLANLGGWHVGEGFSGLFSAVEKVATLQSRAFERSAFETRVVEQEDGDRDPRLAFIRKPIADQETNSSLTLDDRASLAPLFRLFSVQKAETEFATGEIYPAVFAFKGDPKLYRMFLRPFRIRMKSSPGQTTRYLLVKEVTTGGAIVVDEDGMDRPVTEDFILTNWDGEMSWVYPYEHMSGRLTEGMSGYAVLRIQQMLKQMGYTVEPRGVFDNATLGQVLKFQLNFGLKPDGVIDSATKALLYQVSEWA